MNYAILLAIFIQSSISKANRLAGAIVGYLITTGILVWGLDAYGNGDYISFLTIKISKGLFIFFCVVWYLVDTGEFANVISGGTELIDANEKEAEAAINEMDETKSSVPSAD